MDSLKIVQINSDKKTRDKETYVMTGAAIIVNNELGNGFFGKGFEI